MPPTTNPHHPPPPADGSLRRFFHERETNAPRQAIWSAWTDVSTWKHWDEGLADALVDVPFALGVRGMIIPNAGLRSPFEITEFTDGASYTISTRLIAAELHVKRTFVDGSESCRYRHDVWFSGPLAFAWAGLLGPGFRRSLPTTMAKLADFAEAQATTTSEEKQS